MRGTCRLCEGTREICAICFQTRPLCLCDEFSTIECLRCVKQPNTNFVKVRAFRYGIAAFWNALKMGLLRDQNI
jgi:hypothetical protein